MRKLTKVMHDSAVRLYEAAACSGFDYPTAIATAMGISPAMVANWEKRGVSKEGCMKAQEVFGYSSNWILTGAEPKMASVTFTQDELDILNTVSQLPTDQKRTALAIIRAMNLEADSLKAR